MSRRFKALGVGDKGVLVEETLQSGQGSALLPTCTDYVGRGDVPWPG